MGVLNLTLVVTKTVTRLLVGLHFHPPTSGLVRLDVTGPPNVCREREQTVLARSSAAWMLARLWQGGWSSVYPPPTLLPQLVKTTPRFTVRPFNAAVVCQTPVGAGVLRPRPKWTGVRRSQLPLAVGMVVRVNVAL